MLIARQPRRERWRERMVPPTPPVAFPAATRAGPDRLGKPINQAVVNALSGIRGSPLFGARHPKDCREDAV
jgi:hypothetical protein